MTPSQLLPGTRAIVEALEQRSGYPVMFREDPTLKLLATLRTGTPTHPVHQISYRAAERSPDYPIAFEAALALRMFRHAPERRFQMGNNPNGLKAVEEALKAQNPTLEAERLRALARSLFDGILLQVRSCAPGILVDDALYHEHLDLRAPQAASVRAQLAENSRSLVLALTLIPSQIPELLREALPQLSRIDDAGGRVRAGG